MRRLIVLLLVVVFAASVHAQEPPASSWYYAYHAETESLIAYTPDGEQTVMIEDAQIASQGWRLNDGSGLLVVVLDDVARLYHMRGDEYAPLEWVGEEEVNVTDLSGELIYDNGTQAVIQSYSDPFANELVLIDLNAGTFDVIEPRAVLPVRVSEYGDALRYFRFAGDNTWTLREYKMTTGTSRDLFTISERYPYLSADQYGERWLYLQNESREYVLVSLDGTTETVASFSRERPITYRLFEDGLMSNSLTCIEDCVLEWEINGRTLSYPLPPETQTVIPQAALDNFELVVLIEESWFRLIPNDPPVIYGEWSPQMVFTPLGNLMSPDARWLLALGYANTDSVRYQLYGIEGSVVIHAGEGAFLTIRYWDNGFIFANHRDMLTLVYRVSRNEIIDMPFDPPGLYFELLPDDTVLFLMGRTSLEDDTPRGIFHYDIDSQTRTLLVEDAVPIHLQRQEQRQRW